MNDIRVEGLSVTYKYYEKEKGLKGSLKNFIKKEKLFKNAVNNINFSIEEGSIVGFVGLNGAGKTTTLKTLSGIIKPTKGIVKVLEHTPFDKKYEFLKQISLVMGNKSQLWWDIPAIETIELNKSIYEVDQKKYDAVFEELVESLNVKHLLNIQVRRLSLGERMKLELIAALIHSPKVVFLDEPTIGLDIISQINIRDFLKKYNKENNATIILTSHNLDDIEHLCDKLLLINEGEIFYDGGLEDFMNTFSDKKILTVKTKSVISFADISWTDNFNILEISENEIKIEIENNKNLHIFRDLVNQHLDNISDLSIENIDIKHIIKNVLQKKKIIY